MLTRRASLQANSFDPDTRTFIAVAATDTPVVRRDPFEGQFLEVLSLRPEHIRLDRLKSGRAPILDNHRAGSATEQLGVIRNARLEAGGLVITGELRSGDHLQSVADGIAAGIISNVSIGYRVFVSEEARDSKGNRVVTHTDWEPVEVSLVPVPADPKAYIRNAKGTAMEQDTATAADDGRAINPDERRGERNEGDLPNRRMSDRDAEEAYTIASNSGIAFADARRMIENEGMTLTDFRSAAVERRIAVAEATRINPRTSFADSSQTFDNPEFLGRAIESALYARMSGAAVEGPAAEWRGRSLLEMGAALLESRGERVSWRSRDRLASQVMTRAHTTSDFPVLLTQAGNRVLQDAYQANQSPLKALARRRDAVDFRAISMVRLSEAPRLLEVLEGGEITYGSRAEAKEGFKLKTFARIFPITRNAIVNDDLNAFGDSNSAWGRAAAETEADLLVSLFTANSGNGVTLDDGNPLYHTAHANKAASGGALSVATLGAARQALREMKGLDGKTPIGATPRHLVVGPAKETEAEQVLAAIAAAQVSEANPFTGKLQLHVEPRFTGNAWRLFADPAALPTIVIAYLNGQDGPILEERDGWETLGVEFRAVLDFGCGITDWRGTYLNAGS